MAVAEFEEKTVETAYNMELACGVGGQPAVYSPGQVLEGLVGFDVAAAPGTAHPVWGVLGLSRPPGVRLLPTLWGPPGTPRGGVHLPSWPASLILQFKRPEYMVGPTSRQWRLWGHPYYRFTRNNRQHRILTKFERGVGDRAVVRYAAPAFHTYGALEVAQLSGRIVQSFGHVSPVRLGSHKVWTYVDAGGWGRGNPAGPREPFERLSDLIRPRQVPLSEFREYLPSQELERLEDLAAHLRGLAANCQAADPTFVRGVRRWATEAASELVRGLSADIPEMGRREQPWVDLVVVQSFM
jgi:hypothetical protein